MAIDPRNYDVAELRTTGAGEPLARREAGMADGESETAEESDSERGAATTAFRESVTRDLAVMEQGAEDLTRPYLTALPGSLVAEALVFEWLEFLVLQAGEESVADALAFYERVGWLGSDAADALDDYLWGINEPQANEANELDPDDHRVSLHYVARLAAVSRD
ncbi:FlaD/FlaE family flagellar protein [Haloplanus sp. C73]|uniref:FlaD/FlaE family flagellar protein n=1 Tax=Haloplanus sp. C73 TaxID=3421641 RepID=UPI003EB9E287